MAVVEHEERAKATATLEEDIAPLEIVREEDLGPEEFLKLVKRFAVEIQTVQIQAPRMGEGGFGKLRVKYAMPRLRKVAGVR